MNKKITNQKLISNFIKTNYLNKTDDWLDAMEEFVKDFNTFLDDEQDKCDITPDINNLQIMLLPRYDIEAIETLKKK